MHARFGIHLALEAFAVEAVNARPSPVVGLAQDSKGQRERMQSELLRPADENVSGTVIRERREGKRLTPMRFERIGARLTRNAYFIFRLSIVGFKILVSDGPVFDRSTWRHAVKRLHLEIFLHEPPR